jgi:hypothetical protein
MMMMVMMVGLEYKRGLPREISRRGRGKESIMKPTKHYFLLLRK